MLKEMTINGLRLRYTDSGTGPKAIVLMHGWGCDHTTLASLERVALECGRRVINVDFPGFGESQEPESCWGVEEYTQAIEKLVDSLSLDRPALLGHSFGGRVGIVYASRRPVEKLLLVDAAGVKPKRSLRYHLKVWSFKATKRLMYLRYGREEAEKRLDAERARRGSSDYASASPRMRQILSKVVNEDLCHLMPSISAPTLLIWGENDTATPLADARKMEKLIPDAGLVSYPGAGHYSFLDRPAQTAAVIRSFLNS